MKSISKAGKIITICLLVSSQAWAQLGGEPDDLNDGVAKWISDHGKLYAISAKIGIGTNDPFRKLHIEAAGHQYMRTTSTGGTEYGTYVSGLELRRTLNNGQSVTWDLVNQGMFKIRRNAFTLFNLQLDEAQFGTLGNKTTVHIWGNPIADDGGGSPDHGSLVLRNHQSGEYRTMWLDGNQLETSTDFRINALSESNVSIGKTNDIEARLNVKDNDDYQLKLINTGEEGASWRIGATNSDWAAGGGKLVFTPTSGSSDATFLLDNAGNVGIGTPNPERTLDVNGTTRTKVLQITGGADIAEPFIIAEEHTIKPGMVVTIDPENPGGLRVASKAYDKKVAGVISGAGNVQPGMVMAQEGTLAGGNHPVALAGRVYCWVNAANGSIEPGDLLTTSDTPGHAMKVINHSQANGAIIGKAMTGLEKGKGLVLVLVSMQ